MNSPLALVVVVLAASVLSVGVCRRLGLPSLLGYLTVGMLLGPQAFKLIPDSAQARAIAEYGIVFLMFSIGLEFSLPQFRSMRRLVLGLGSAQYLLSLLLFALIALALAQSFASAVVLGAALAMSSTAIGIKLLAERNELSAPVAKPVIGVLLFAGLTAYDTQKIKSMYFYVRGTDFVGKSVVMGALTLYLDFVNMFTFLLNMMGSRD